MSEENETPKKEGGLETIIPVITTTEIAGMTVKVNRLRFRETIALWRVIASASKHTNLNIGALNSESILSVLIMALPYAERELLDFIKTILEVPSEEVTRKLYMHIDKKLENAEVLNILEIIIEQEKDSWAELGKQLAHLGEVFQRSFKPNPGQS